MNERSRDAVRFWVVLAAAAVLLVCGWRLFWFLTDDAYISFRYVSNSHDGLGYVWNAPPFRPVEGYTNFLWVVLLDLTWRVLGVEPPVSANWLSLAFALGTLALSAYLLWRVPAGTRLQPWRPALLAVALLGIVTNRTFLAWSSSGLETALFGFCVMAWIVAAWRTAATGPRAIGAWWALAAAAAGIALTRPDGLLFCAATAAYAALHFRAQRRPSTLMALTPMLLVIAHVLWRHHFYGAWLPNTFYAKNAGPWLESGWRYAASFVLEYGLVVWLTLALWWGGRALRTGMIRTPPPWHALMVAGALAAHFAYYTVLVGGDHFEYRVYNHLVPVLFITALGFLTRLQVRPATAMAWLAVFVIASWPIPWTHWRLSHKLETRVITLKVPVAPAWPALVRPYASAFDSLQAWLINHYVCMRHQEHKIASEVWLRDVLPARTAGAAFGPQDYPVLGAFGGIGGLGWVLPHVNIIDLYGLNDYVVARTPLRPNLIRRMAHDRSPPADYLASFRPNVSVATNGIQVLPRTPALTADAIRAAETYWAQQVGGGAPAL